MSDGGDAARVLFTGDTHFGHANVIKYAHRPFKHVDEMDETLIANWNAVVRPQDRIYHLGDFSFYRDIGRTLTVLARLNGKKYLVFGNHDKKLRKDPRFLEWFVETGDLMTVKVEDPRVEGGHQRIELCHYAMRVWNKSHFGAWQLYGHSHGSLRDDPNARQTDVGVDAWGYTPVSYAALKPLMAAKKFKPVDHHRARD